MNAKLTLKSGKSILKACGMSISKRDGEYRVTAGQYTFPVYTNAEREAMAYYTDDLNDAVSTGQHMAQKLRGISAADVMRCRQYDADKAAAERADRATD